MPSLNDILCAMYGVWRIALRDPKALGYFDFSENGFWRSFSAIVLTLPVSLYFHYQAGAEFGVIDLLRRVMIYTVAWLAYPVVMHRVLIALDRGERFVDYVVAYNWASLPLAYILLVTTLFTETDILSGSIGAFILISVYFWSFVYFWELTRRTLSVGHGPAFGIVGFDLIFSLLVIEILESVWVTVPAA